MIKSVGAKRVLDVEGKGTADGNPIIAYPELESSLVEGQYLTEFILLYLILFSRFQKFIP
jgi:hypothetical protein